MAVLPAHLVARWLLLEDVLDYTPAPARVSSLRLDDDGVPFVSDHASEPSAFDRGMVPREQAAAASTEAPIRLNRYPRPASDESLPRATLVTPRVYANPPSGQPDIEPEGGLLVATLVRCRTQGDDCTSVLAVGGCLWSKTTIPSPRP